MVGRKLWSLIIVGVFMASTANAGSVTAGICYAGCMAMTAACFTAAGFTFGTVPATLVAATPELAACNAAFGVCEAGCVAALLVPIP